MSELLDAVLAVADDRTLSRGIQMFGLPDGGRPRPRQEIVQLFQDAPDLKAEFLLPLLGRGEAAKVCRKLGLDSSGDKDELIDRLIAYARGGEPKVQAVQSQEPVPSPATVPAPVVTAEDDEFCVDAVVEWPHHHMFGVVIASDKAQIQVRFDNGDKKIFTRQSKVLNRVGFAPGDAVARASDSGTIGMILERGAGISWKVAFAGDPRPVDVVESALRPAVERDPLAKMRSGQPGTAEAFNLRTVAADYWLAHRHNDLVSLAHARVDLKPHQVSVVHRVVSRYPSRFLLCDEVGLGKTIEAAMVIKELRARGLGRRVLILVPAGLARQWQFELKTKFNEPFAIYNRNTVAHLKDKGVVSPWTDSDSIITSHSWASHDERRRKELSSVDWDMVIVDEAHHARLQKFGSRTQRTNLYRLVHELVGPAEFRNRSVLFLTATPLQLARVELYSLVEMLDPILFSSEDDFVDHVGSLAGLSQTVEKLLRDGKGDADARSELQDELEYFMDCDDEEAERLVEELSAQELAEELRSRHRLSEVLVRNRKAVVGGFMPRTANKWEVTLSEQEWRVHELMDVLLTEGFDLAARSKQNAVGFLMVMFEQLLTSSSRALLRSLEGRRERLQPAGPATDGAVDDTEEALETDNTATAAVAKVAPVVEQELQKLGLLVEELRKIPLDSKAKILRDRLTELFEEEPAAKVLVFTQFRETQEMLAELLGAHWPVHLFHGQMAPEKKDREIAAFRDQSGPRILVSTEAGGEGRNFQFCHILVNYDLPWNPMKVEQRIGRIDRIGQDHPIAIFNFKVNGTIEERILEVLEKRIKIFTEAVGGLDPILGETEADIRDALKRGRKERDDQLKRLGERLETDLDEARRAQVQLKDMILDTKSYSADIARRLLQVESPIEQAEFEIFLEKLAAAANTYIGRPTASGERELAFHPPFTSEHPDLFVAGDKLRVCFNPRANVDSEFVEYFGFGHPLVDALTKRAIEKEEGAAAVKSVWPSAVNRPGWLFNWIVRVGGLRPYSFLHPVFVDDAASVSVEDGQRLVLKARTFPKESCSEPIPAQMLEGAYSLAAAEANRIRTEAADEARRSAEERAEIEEGRATALYDQRLRAAKDRVESCRTVLERMRASPEEGTSRVIPVWEANVKRAEAEVEAVADDYQAMLAKIRQTLDPNAELELLNVARIVPRAEESVPTA